MPIPVVYRKSSEVLVNYDYTDILEGTGTIVFYGLDTTDNAARSYSLTSQQVHSDKLLTYGDGSAGGEEKVLDIDFDVSPFVFPQNIKGQLRAVVPLITGHESTINKEGTCYVKIKVRKWDGSTETELASNTKSRTMPGSASSDTTQDVMSIDIDLTTGYHFEAGEQLRITVEVWALTQGASKIQLGLYHDPKNRSGIVSAPAGNSGYYPGGFDATEFITSILQFHVPFKLNL